MPVKKRVLKVVAGMCAVGVLLGTVALGAVVWSIRQSVQENCRVAQQAHPHPGDDVAALADFMNSRSHSPQERTHIGVWTLGRLRNPHAVPALQSAYTGAECEHDQDLCQYELEKAIKLCGGTPNPPRETKH
jgi:hypothetical protein